MSCCLRVLCYRNRTQAAAGRLLSLVPGLEPPIGICSTRPSDTIKTRVLQPYLSIENIQRGGGDRDLQMARKDDDGLNQFLDQDPAIPFLGRHPDGLDVETLQERCHLIESGLQLVLKAILGSLVGDVVPCRSIAAYR